MATRKAPRKQKSKFPIAIAAIIGILVVFFVVYFATAGQTAQFTAAAGLNTVSKTAYGGFVNSLKVTFDKEYNTVQLYAEGTPGGEWCGTSIEVKAFNAAGTQTARYFLPRVDTHKVTKKTLDCAAVPANCGGATSVKVKSVSARPWPPPDQNLPGDCDNIDKLSVTLAYKAPVAVVT